MTHELLPSEKIYCISQFAKVCLLLPTLFVICFIGFGPLIFSPDLSKNFEYFVVIIPIEMVGAAFIMSMYRVLQHIRLVLTHDGITFYSWDYSMYTPWQNVVGVHDVYSYLFPLTFDMLTGLKLHQPALLGMTVEDGRRQGIATVETKRWSSASAMAPYTGVLPIIKIIGGRNWQKGVVGREIQIHAPQAFTAGVSADHRG